MSGPNVEQTAEPGAVDYQDALTERMRARFEQYHPAVNVYEIMAALADEVRHYDRADLAAAEERGAAKERERIAQEPVATIDASGQHGMAVLTIGGQRFVLTPLIQETVLHVGKYVIRMTAEFDAEHGGPA